MRGPRKPGGAGRCTCGRRESAAPAAGAVLRFNIIRVSVRPPRRGNGKATALGLPLPCQARGSKTSPEDAAHLQQFAKRRVKTVGGLRGETLACRGRTLAAGTRLQRGRPGAAQAPRRERVPQAAATPHHPRPTECDRRANCGMKLERDVQFLAMVVFGDPNVRPDLPICLSKTGLPLEPITAEPDSHNQLPRAQARFLESFAPRPSGSRGAANRCRVMSPRSQQRDTLGCWWLRFFYHGAGVSFRSKSSTQPAFFHG